MHWSVLYLIAPSYLDELRRILKDLEEDEKQWFLSEKLSPVETKLIKHCSITIIFSALAVEAYIYDYAARKLTDNFVESHIDRINLISKWIVVTKLVVKKDFPEDSRAFQMLKQLIKNRNYIVHSKSTSLMKLNEVSLTGKESPEDLPKLLYSGNANKLIEFENSILDKAKEAIATLDELSVVMESLDPDEVTSTRFRSRVGRAKEQWTITGVWPWWDDE